MMKRTLLLLCFTLIFASFSTFNSYAKKAPDYIMGIGETILLYEGEDDPGCTYISNDTNLLNADPAGTIQALKKGTTTVACFHGDGTFKKNYRIQIKKAPSNLSLEESNLSLFPKESITLLPYVNKKAGCCSFTFSSSRKDIATISKKGVLKGKKVGTTTLTITTYNDITTTCKVRIKSDKKLVALTFDDGPVHANTKRLLDALKKYDYHATFFMLGYEVKGNEDLLKKMVAQNHEIGLHTWDHPYMTKLDESQMKKQITKADTAIFNACDVHPDVMRPPYGAYNKTVLSVAKKCDLPFILWNIDVKDWATTNASKVSSEIIKQCKDGSILVLHDSHKSSVDALMTALPKLNEKGYELVTVSQLASLRGTTLKPGVRYYGE